MERSAGVTGMLPGSVSCGKFPALLTCDRPGPPRPSKFSANGEGREGDSVWFRQLSFLSLHHPGTGACLVGSGRLRPCAGLAGVLEQG